MTTSTPLKFINLPIDSINIAKTYDNFLENHKFLHNYWFVGEINSHQQLEDFIINKILNYGKNRDFPRANGCSQLSPALRWGCITDAQIYWMIHHYHHLAILDHNNIWPIPLKPSLPYKDPLVTEPFIRQLGWRNFSYHLLWHYPSMITENLKKNFDKFPWVTNNIHLNCWKNGQTGFPIVDAGMRQLIATGQIPNRVRMIVASFLTKDLKIHWTEGAKHFWEYLMDADEANNSASWQWVAGCGMDAAPYFRIFNPILQSMKFDPQGLYIKQWIPELAKVNYKYIHDPWNYTHDIPIKLGQDYPTPIVDHSIERQKALEYYKSLSHNE